MKTLPLVLVLALVACTPDQPSDRPPVLLVPVYFYQGHTVGKANRTTGLQVSRDDGKTFTCAAWPELITNSVAVDSDRRSVYLACGNGVLASRDAGRTWRLTGGWEMTEVQRVRIDPRDPRRVRAATAYGVFTTDDVWAAGNPWRKLSDDRDFRYCTDVLPDAAHAKTVWVAAHRGLFVSRDGGASYSAAIPGVPVRRIHRDDSGRIWAATDGRGLQRTGDEGRTFRRIDGPPDTTFCVTTDPRDSRVVLVGSREGLSVSHDGGTTWSTSRVGLPEDFLVYGVLPHPTVPGGILVSGNDGVLRSDDHGRTFHRLGFEGALIPDLGTARLADIPAVAPRAAAAGLVLETEALPSAPRDPSYEARRDGILAHFRRRPARDGRAWPGLVLGALAARDGRTSPAFWRELLESLETPKRSMFFSMPLMGFFLHARDRLPPEVAERIREVMTTNPVYRGDTENHWVMHYATLLLAAETWPETPASRWATGQTTQEIHDEAKGWLVHWARLTATRGQGEFDSPNYMLMYVTPMLLLRDFARDGEVKRLAGMMLDLLLADYFAESLHGAWTGGHSRIIGKEVELTTGNRVAFLHHLYAGGIPMPEMPHGWAVFAALSGYRAPAVLAAIADRRDAPYLHTEVKRVRNVIRFGRDLNPPVFKTDYMTPRYALGSLQGGILQPIQQHTWDVTWIGSAENSTVFTVHPSISARELAMFFPEEIHGLTRVITAQKGVYASPDKLVSASPWEKVVQDENVLLALYRVPADERFPFVTLYAPDHLARTEEEGWTFGRDGEFWMAWFACREGKWTDREDHDVFRCLADRAGFVFVVRPPGSGTFEEFRKKIRTAPPPVLEGEGDDLRLRWGSHVNAWSKAAPFPSDHLFRGPFLNSRVGTGVIEMTDGETVRTLDFNDFTTRETRR